MTPAITAEVYRVPWNEGLGRAGAGAGLIVEVRLPAAGKGADELGRLMLRPLGLKIAQAHGPIIGPGVQRILR